MKIKTTMLGLSRISIIFIMVILSGCQQLREDLADVISPPNDAQMAALIADRSEAGNVLEAIAIGEKFLVAHQGANPNVRAKLVQLYLHQGDAAKALAHLVESNNLDSGVEAAIPQSPAKASGLQTAPSVSATVSPTGIEASAGNANVTVK